MDLELAGRVVMVTGASAGIGRATALALADEGALLALGARDAERLAAVEEETRLRGAKVVTVAGDLVAPDGVRSLAQRAIDTFGSIHGLVCCVGSTPLGDFEDLTDETWQQAFDMKFLATIRAIRAVLPTMLSQGDGRIAVVAGNVAQEPTPFMLTSGAINAALGNLTSGLARTFGARGVGVNCINPGPVRTARYEGMRSAVMQRESLDEQDAELFIEEMIPDRHIPTPDEIAAQIAFVLSPLARHMNGTSVMVDGAQTWAR